MSGHSRLQERFPLAPRNDNGPTLLWSGAVRSSYIRGLTPWMAAAPRSLTRLTSSSGGPALVDSTLDPASLVPSVSAPTAPECACLRCSLAEWFALPYYVEVRTARGCTSRGATGGSKRYCYTAAPIIDHNVLYYRALSSILPSNNFSCYFLLIVFIAEFYLLLLYHPLL